MDQSRLRRIENRLRRIGSPSAFLIRCDNTAATHIANNHIFHEKTKHIEVKCYYIWDLVQAGITSTDHVISKKQVADMFTKHLPIVVFTKYCIKLNMINIYAPT